ncbi:dienelactone hydrolase endo-1-3,1,4-beta-D-glucanase [Trametopsis cervina]|nr:dienelactone hydrolase endo-1-3,1,4-beta-D-glucanase [Trametopsis cervina]
MNMASCEHCTQGYVLPGEPEGTLVDGAYFHAAPSAAEGNIEQSSRAIVLLTDIFGLPLKNSKIIADTLSTSVGCDVWIPDIFAPEGPPVEADEMEPLVAQRPGENTSFFNKLRFLFLVVTRLHKFYALRASVVDARAAAFVKKLKEEKKYTKIGAVGYCFGGAMAVRLGSAGLFDAIVIAHPGRVTLAEVEAIKVPSSWACAEDDMTFKKPLRDQAEAHFAGRKGKPEYIEYEFVDYKGTVHGFAARPNFAISEVVEAFNGALDQTVAWFKKYL